MHRDEYLGLNAPQHTPHVVRDFINWLSANLNNQPLFAHSYADRRTKKVWQFNGLEDACRQYYWKHKGALGVPGGSDLVSNHAALTALQKALQHSVTLTGSSGDQAACSAASEVMKWGGVAAHNVGWLQANTHGLATMFAAVTEALNRGDLTNSLLKNGGLRFNAGMTKVYSLLAKDFIIYDSRVAAALGWIVVKFCQIHKFTQVPAELDFPYADAKEDRTAEQPKNRNPRQQQLRFQRLRSGPLHAEWNLKAGWILQAVLAQDKASQFAQPSAIVPLRRLEAALFMIGYDLPQASATQGIAA